MIMAIASGKGGTGKTTVATNLATVAGESVQLIDCDVEEPNCHLFLKPVITHSEPVEVMVPLVDEAKCDSTGKCGEICAYSAIVCLGGKPLVFPELCHGCLGCLLACPQKAISEGKREVGVLEEGSVGSLKFIHGRLRIGESMPPPLIKAVKARAHNGARSLTVIDAPPGTSCSVVESVKGADYVLLVTEPTPFGLNDLTLAVELVRALDLPFGVVINRADSGDNQTREYCEHAGVPVLLEIPDDRRVAEAYSRGELASHVVAGYDEMFRGLLSRIEKEARR